jgi:hypothetical protein
MSACSRGLQGLTLVALLWAACGDGSSPEPHAVPLAEHPIASRYAPVRLPYKLRTDPFGREMASFVGRRVYVDANGGGNRFHELKATLTAIVALDDRVVVVFPPADRDGFDLAIGGFDVPWHRVPLTDVMPAHIGDLSAVRDGDGTVWIAMRRRGGDMAMTLYRWREGEPVTSEEVPRPYGVTSHGFHDTCEDLAFGIAPNGAQDLVFQQVDDVGRSQVYHVHRPSARDPWQTRVVLSSHEAVLGTPAPGRLHVVGCRSVLAHDDTGRPQVITMQQNLSADVLRSQVTPQPIPSLRLWGLFLSADGVWLHAREGYLPDERSVIAGATVRNWDDTDDSYAGQVDLERHPEGFLVAGPSLPPEHAALRHAYSLFPVSLAYDFEAVDFGEYKYETVQPQNFDNARAGGKMTINECGVTHIYGEPVAAGEQRRQLVAAGKGGPGCAFAKKAPFVSEERLEGVGRYPRFARGIRPYDVAVCADGEAGDELVICHGVHETGGADALYAVDDLPQIASIQPGDGKLTGQEPIVVQMNRPPGDGEDPMYHLVRTLDGTPPVAYQAQWDAREGRLTITPTEPWKQGQEVRLAAWYDRADRSPESWLYLETPRPIKVLRAGAAPWREDPRDAPPRLACDWGGMVERGGDGVCMLTEPVLPAGDVRWIPVPYDPARLSTDPWIEGPNGEVAPSEMFSQGGLLQLRWTEPLEGNARYDIVLPSDAKNLVGSAIHPDDRRIGMRTLAPPPAIVSTVPASGAVDVDLSAPIDVVFNTPVSIPASAVTLSSTASSVPVSIVQTDAVTYQLLHEPLQPQTVYTLTFNAQITNGYAASLVGAPRIFTFTTGE